MALTKEQIYQLYTFTQRHFVDWYDLQTELVDHLANDIESICTENPNLTFEQACDISFKKFGICGFNDVVVERQKALHKKYWLLIWQFFKTFFKLPRIILTLLLIIIIYIIFDSITYKNNVALISLLGIAIVPYIFILYNVYKMKQRQKTTGKKWLFENVTYTFGGLLAVIQLPLQFQAMGTDNINWSETNQIIFSSLLVFMSIVYYIAIKIIPQRMKETLSNSFPEYKLSAKT